VNLTATITVKGDPAQLQGYRGHVKPLLDEDGGAQWYRELHSRQQLEYHFTLRGGIPFPAFVAASQAFPELTVEVEWTEAAQGRSGRAVIRDGALRDQTVQSHAASGETLHDVHAGADGGLRIAVACRRWHDAWHGYVVAADQHAFFSVRGTAAACELSASDGVDAEWAERWTVAAGETAHSVLGEREPIAESELRELDRLSREFALEWIWFEESPLEETAVERERFLAYGTPVREANLRSEKLRKVLRPEEGGFALGTFGAGTRWIPELLGRCWLRGEQARR
jgi:hypothetical protein